MKLTVIAFLRLTDVPIPECKTLVAAGQYDSFTLPHENANLLCNVRIWNLL